MGVKMMLPIVAMRPGLGDAETGADLDPRIATGAQALDCLGYGAVDLISEASAVSYASRRIWRYTAVSVSVALANELADQVHLLCVLARRASAGPQGRVGAEAGPRWSAAEPRLI